MDTEGEKAKGVRTHQLERWWQGLPRDKGEDVEAGDRIQHGHRAAMGAW